MDAVIEKDYKDARVDLGAIGELCENRIRIFSRPEEFFLSHEIDLPMSSAN